ncbi:MAG: hypothetical protein E5V63_14810 [Mesorhizobium sp.]|nr:MAG: hypothetical protein E5V63_14810 [Mesorhizobium sp.]
MAKALRAAKAKAPAMDAGKEPSAPAAAPVSDAPSSGAATGTNSTDDPPESDQGGAGNAAGSAGSADALFEIPADHLDAEAEFRAKFPFLSAAFEAWHVEHEDTPSGLRIKSKVEGFRRAGMVHTREPAEYPAEAFSGPEQLEALLAEPNLTVELI